MGSGIVAIILLTCIVQSYGQAPPRPTRAPTTPAPPPEPKVKGVSIEKIQELIDIMWANDMNKYDIEDYVNRGIKAIENSKPPLPLGRLFEVDESKLFLKPATKLLKDMFDNIETTKRDPTVDELKPFLAEIARTPTMERLRDFLKLYNYSEAETQEKFTNDLNKLWLSIYPRGSHDSSAFLHVFIGEYGEPRGKRPGQIGGLHSWLRYVYLQNKKACSPFLYFGYKDYQKNFLSVQFNEGKYVKPTGSFFYGTSPEFDLAAFTLCYLAKPGKDDCKIKMHQGSIKDRYEVKITTIEKECRGRKFICTAYPCRDADCSQPDDTSACNAAC